MQRRGSAAGPDSAGVAVRRATPADEDAIRRLFTAGMSETISSGLRQAVVLTAAKTAAVCLPVCVAVLACWGGRWSSRWFLCALALALVGFLAFLWLVPQRVAMGYVTKSLKRDYMNKQGLHELLVAPVEKGRGVVVWVATLRRENGAGAVVGTVAVEAPDPEVNPKAKGQAKGHARPQAKSEGQQGNFASDAKRGDSSWAGWAADDAELRRMSVDASARGRGVARKLFETLQDHCSTARLPTTTADTGTGGGTPGRRFQRIVLSTSDMQHVACTKLYPRLGFEVVHRTPLFGGLVTIHFFAKAL